MTPRVVQVIPMKGYSVYIYFEDGRIVRYDMAPMVGEGVFAPLRNIEVFMNTCTVLNDTLAWDLSGTRDETRCLDIAPETLYALPSAREVIA